MRSLPLQGFLGCICLFWIVGCGGAKNQDGIAPPVGASAPPVGSSQEQQMQRAVADQALSAVQAAGLALTFEDADSGVTTLAYKRRLVMDAAERTVSGAFRSRTSIASAAPAVYGPCNAGIEYADTVISLTEADLYLKLFYDASCTNLFESSFLDIVASGASSASANGNVVEYNTSGSIVSYQTFQEMLTNLGSSSAAISIRTANSASQTASPFESLNMACTIGSSNIGCGSGEIVHNQALNVDQGESALMTVSESAANTAVTVPITGSGTQYTGNLNALSMTVGTLPAWIISGGTTADAASFSGQIVYSTVGLPMSGTLTVTDSANNETVTLTVNGTQSSGVVTQTSSGTTFATFTIDQYGNGTITYANGTTADISQWQIVQ